MKSQAVDIQNENSNLQTKIHKKKKMQGGWVEKENELCQETQFVDRYIVGDSIQPENLAKLLFSQSVKVVIFTSARNC